MRTQWVTTTTSTTSNTYTTYCDQKIQHLLVPDQIGRGLYPCSTKRREGLENPSPTPKISRDPRDFPRAKPEGNLEDILSSLPGKVLIAQWAVCAV